MQEELEMLRCHGEQLDRIERKIDEVLAKVIELGAKSELILVCAGRPHAPRPQLHLLDGEREKTSHACEVFEGDS